jgi:hypothetical protein
MHSVLSSLLMRCRDRSTAQEFRARWVYFITAGNAIQLPAGIFGASGRDGEKLI